MDLNELVLMLTLVNFVIAFTHAIYNYVKDCNFDLVFYSLRGDQEQLSQRLETLEQLTIHDALAHDEIQGIQINEQNT